MGNSGWLAAFGANQHYLGGIHGAFRVNDTALLAHTGAALHALLIMLQPSTITLPSFGLTARTLPFLPLSLPERITTVSPVLTCTFIHLQCTSITEPLGQGQRSSGNPCLTKFSRHWPKNTSAPWVFIFSYNDSRVLVKADISAVFTSNALNGTNDNCFNNVAFFNNAAGCSFLDGSNYDVADIGVSSYWSRPERGCTSVPLLRCCRQLSDRSASVSQCVPPFVVEVIYFRKLLKILYYLPSR